MLTQVFLNCINTRHSNFIVDKMRNSRFLFFIIITLFHFCSNEAADSSCPIDFEYVKTFPWDTSLCREPLQPSCCQTLRSLFGIGLAKLLNQTSIFYLSDANVSSSCITSFRQKIESMGIGSSLFPACFNSTAEFVNNGSTSCAGIATVRDWNQRVDTVLPLESSCKEDLTGLTRCSTCLEAGLKVNSYLVSLYPNSTKCFFFAVLYAAGVINDFGPEDVRSAACIFGLPLSKSANSRGSSSDNRSRRFIFGFVGGLVGICSGVALFLAYRKWDKKKKQDLMHENYVSSVKSMVLPNAGAKWFQVAELERATDGFSQKKLIGQGGFGVVYKGTLLDGTEVAVKKILDLDSTGDDEFKNEALIISKIRHRNLLPLRGFCVASDRFHGKRRYLVYDYMPNGSLNDHIFTSNQNQQQHYLSWPQRKNIILDIAKGLAYLHNGIKPAIYHRDIKATNILLDTDMKARVADFGLAKQNPQGQSHLTTRVAGTHGYLAPEYALYGHFTEKIDVYSFGILILEIMSSRRVLDASDPSRMLITDWAWGLLKGGRVEEVFDECIREGGAKGIMERFVRVGVLCAHVMVALRPTIAEALKMLEGDVDIPRLPDRPLPLTHHIMHMPFSSTTTEGSRATSTTTTSE